MLVSKAKLTATVNHFKDRSCAMFPPNFVEPAATCQ